MFAVSAKAIEPAPRNRRNALLMWVALSLLLISPVFFNGFPLVFPDTSAYLEVAFEHAWTVDRSGFYGLALKPFVTNVGAVSGLWIGVLCQVVAIAAVLVGTVRHLLPRITASQIAAVLLLTMLTSLPWHAAQLMPDAFAGPLVLVTWMAATRELAKSGTALLWLSAAGITLLHYTYLGIMPAVAIMCLAIEFYFGTGLREIMRRSAVLMLCVGAVISAHVAVNGLKFDRWSVTPMGSMFLFARVNEDGLVDHWFARHCGRDAPQDLCALRRSIPRDSQQLLWSTSSPLNSRIHAQVGQPESWHWIDEFHQAAVDSIIEEPIAFGKNSIAAMARQFVHFQALDDECPSECHMRHLIVAHPSLGPPLNGSPQVRGDIRKNWIRAVTTVIATCSLIAFLPMLVLAFRRRDRDAFSLILAISAALIVNAALAGALSDVHDRYQSRLVWLVPTSVLIVLLRWRALHSIYFTRSPNYAEAPARGGG